MKILVTGASGYIGNKLAHTLAEMGNEVHALVRSTSAKAFLQHKNIKIFKGNILQKQGLIDAITGCQQVYHTAAQVGAWASDSSIFYKVNVEGTRNVLDAALQAGIEKTVFTSTCGVIGPTPDEPLDENSLRTVSYEIDYDFSKKLGEDLVRQYAKAGMNVVVVSPAKVYGPGYTSHSLTANAIIRTFLKKRIAIIPSPGTYMVCFCFIDDVVNGHLLTMERGVPGERYILGGNNISYEDFFNQIRKKCRGKRYIIPLPRHVIKAAAYLQEINYKLTGSPIRFTVKSVNHLFSNYKFSSKKAIRELGYQITPLDEALDKTIHFINNAPYG